MTETHPILAMIGTVITTAFALLFYWVVLLFRWTVHTTLDDFPSHDLSGHAD